SLIPGNKYKIAIEVEGFETTYDYLDIQSMETFVQVEHNVEVYSDDYKNREDIQAVKKATQSLQDKLNIQIARIKEFASEDSLVYEKVDLNQRITKMEKYNRETSESSVVNKEATKGGLEPAGDKSIKGLSFKVEIAAVKDTNDFKV